VDLASAVGCVVVDFDGGCRFVDVDTADERELVDACSGDCVDGQGCRVQWVCHRGQPGGEDVCWCAVMSSRGRCSACRGGEFGCALAPGTCGTVCHHAGGRRLRGDPVPVVLARGWFGGPLLSGASCAGR
jgi:hypothetical protein